MNDEFQTRALRLLAEDAQLADGATRVLHALITASPVALRGEETMVPVAHVVARLRDPGERRRGDADADALLETLEDVAAAQWKMPSWRGFAVGVFINSYWMGRDAVFLHFQIDDGFIDALDQIRLKLASGSRDLPNRGGH